MYSESRTDRSMATYHTTGSLIVLARRYYSDYDNRPQKLFCVTRTHGGRLIFKYIWLLYFARGKAKTTLHTSENVFTRAKVFDILCTEHAIIVIYKAGVISFIRRSYGFSSAFVQRAFHRFIMCTRQFTISIHELAIDSNENINVHTAAVVSIFSVVFRNTVNLENSRSVQFSEVHRSGNF